MIEEEEAATKTGKPGKHQNHSSTAAQKTDQPGQPPIGIWNTPHLFIVV